MIDVKSADCISGTPAPTEIDQSLNLFAWLLNGDTFAEPEENVLGYFPSVAAVESCAKLATGIAKASEAIAKLNFIVYYYNDFFEKYKVAKSHFVILFSRTTVILNRSRYSNALIVKIDNAIKIHV